MVPPSVQETGRATGRGLQVGKSFCQSQGLFRCRIGYQVVVIKKKPGSRLLDKIQQGFGFQRSGTAFDLAAEGGVVEDFFLNFMDPMVVDLPKSRIFHNRKVITEPIVLFQAGVDDGVIIIEIFLTEKDIGGNAGMKVLQDDTPDFVLAYLRVSFLIGQKDVPGKVFLIKQKVHVEMEQKSDSRRCVHQLRISIAKPPGLWITHLYGRIVGLAVMCGSLIGYPVRDQTGNGELVRVFRTVQQGGPFQGGLKFSGSSQMYDISRHNKSSFLQVMSV